MMGYFISIYYKDDIPAQRIWANTKAIAAIDSGDPRLNSAWPGQLCAIGQECAVPPELAMPPNSPTPYIAIFKQVSATVFQLMASGFGFLEKWQILALLDNLPEPTGQGGGGQSGGQGGGGGTLPADGQPGGNPLGFLGLDLFPGFPLWLGLVGLALLIRKKK